MACGHVIRILEGKYVQPCYMLHLAVSKLEWWEMFWFNRWDSPLESTVGIHRWNPSIVFGDNPEAGFADPTLTPAVRPAYHFFTACKTLVEPGGILPNEVVPSKVVPSKVVPSKVVPSKVAPEVMAPEVMANEVTRNPKVGARAVPSARLERGILTS
jgi:hypothetical protein